MAKDWVANEFLLNKSKQVNFPKRESGVVLADILRGESSMERWKHSWQEMCIKKNNNLCAALLWFIQYHNGKISVAPANHDLIYKDTESTPTLLFEEVWEELKPCLTGFSSLAWPDKPQHRNVLSQFSSPVPASLVELFQCREYNLFLSLLKIMGRYTSAESATIFLWLLNNWHGIFAFNARLLNFHIFWKCECVLLSFLPQRP